MTCLSNTVVQVISLSEVGERVVESLSEVGEGDKSLRDVGEGDKSLGDVGGGSPRPIHLVQIYLQG